MNSKFALFLWLWGWYIWQELSSFLTKQVRCEQRLMRMTLFGCTFWSSTLANYRWSPCYSHHFGGTYRVSFVPLRTSIVISSVPSHCRWLVVFSLVLPHCERTTVVSSVLYLCELSVIFSVGFRLFGQLWRNRQRILGHCRQSILSSLVSPHFEQTDILSSVSFLCGRSVIV